MKVSGINKNHEDYEGDGTTSKLEAHAYSHLAMDVRKRLPSGCRLNPATPSVDAGRSKGASIFSAPVFTSIA